MTAEILAFNKYQRKPSLKLPRNHVAPVRYLPASRQLLETRELKDRNETFSVTRIIGYHYPAGFVSEFDMFSPVIASRAITFWKEYGGQANQWVSQFLGLPLARMMDYLHFYPENNDRLKAIRVAHITFASRLTAIAERNVEVAKKIFWELSDYPYLPNQADALAEIDDPRLQARLLAAGGAVRGAIVLEATFNCENFVNYMDASSVLFQQAGLTADEKSILHEMAKKFYLNRGGVKKMIEIRRKMIWVWRLNETFDLEKEVDSKKEEFARKNTGLPIPREIAKKDKRLTALWGSITAALARESTGNLADILEIFKATTSYKILARMLEFDRVDEVLSVLDHAAELECPSASSTSYEREAWWTKHLDNILYWLDDEKYEELHEPLTSCSRFIGEEDEL
ncbi:MAG: hypothetical protein PHG97_04090 [Candidatus Margulisbacteria bacterium]|nr:hypothetical protein [Candidatus Margulisiibacteriota bacterium]